MSAVFAVALTLFALGSAPRRRLSQLFALYTLSAAGFAALAALLRLSLWSGVGDPELLGQLGTFAFILSAPALLLFAAHYAGLSKPWVTVAAIVGVLWSCAFVLPVTLIGEIVYGHSLDANGTTHVQLTTVGLITTSVPIAYLLESFVVLWRSRRRDGGPYMAISTVVLLAGITGGVLLDGPVPLLSFASLLSLLILGYGVLSVQLFNPLRERNRALQLEIAERQRAEAEILHLQHLLQAIANSMPSALITLDLEGRVLTWNPAAETLIGRPAREVVGRRCCDAIPEIRRYRDLIATATTTRVAARRSRDPVETGDRMRYQDVEVFPLISNGVTGVALRIEDVSRRVHFEALTLQTAKMVSVGRLATGLAHELNNPLGAVMQGVQMLALLLNPERVGARAQMEALGVDPDALARYVAARGMHDYLREMRLAGERAAHIVSDLLEFSQKSEVTLKPHDLNELLQAALDLAAADYDLKKQYDFREIELVWDLAPDLPSVLCDGSQIQQALLNLLQNAGQAMAAHSLVRVAQTAGGPASSQSEPYRPRLVLGTRRVAQAVRLSIADNGPGIDPAIAGRLFEPFVTTRDVGEGSGLGLWLCWSIVVEHHGGRVWLEQNDGGGACFVVELPIDGNE